MRLISFLGALPFRETTYSFENQTCQTCYIAHALATFVKPDEIHLIATTEAWDLHGKELPERLIAAELPTPSEKWVPTGATPDELWKMFGVIIDSVRTSTGPVLLDITHGFRSQPFFAAACVQYVQAVVPNPPDIRVVYGEFRGTGQISPIWELTPFVEVLSWSRSLMMFLKSGQGDGVTEPTFRLGRELNRQWAMEGKMGEQPTLAQFSSALQGFSDDFTTIRTSSLLIGPKATARRLADAIDETRQVVKTHLPALAFILDQVRAMVEPLLSRSRLSEPVGQRTLLALARLYQTMGRYSEAISVLREGWITLQASPEADHPGVSLFDRTAWTEQEQAWRTRFDLQARSVAEVRNDIQHAGFTELPKNRDWFEKQLEQLLKAWEDAIDASENTTDENT